MSEQQTTSPNSKRLTELSRKLSYWLRHRPQAIGINLDAQGWVPIAQLLEQANAHGHAIDAATLFTVVEQDEKMRYALDVSKQKIRANQGHSVAVDLKLANKVPPVVLYHGTPTKNLASILKQGLHPQARHAVHLSAVPDTARMVGARRGEAVVLKVDAKAMLAAGFTFQCADNGVWLTAHVPPKFLSQGP